MPDNSQRSKAKQRYEDSKRLYKLRRSIKSMKPDPNMIRILCSDYREMKGMGIAYYRSYSVKKWQYTFPKETQDFIIKNGHRENYY